jgi:predicted esterase
MPPSTSPDFEHVFVPANGAKVTLLLLHGTGGNEHDLVPLGAELLPGAALLSPRGQVLENGMLRFFRRFAEGVFDVPDLHARADALASWVTAQVSARGAPATVVAVGYSNGANIAAAVLLRSTGVLSGAVLFRVMIPFAPADASASQLAGVRVLVSEGDRDALVPREHGERLARLLRDRGADVTLVMQHAEHGLVAGDVRVATEFLARHRPS